LLFCVDNPVNKVSKSSVITRKFGGDDMMKLK